MLRNITQSNDSNNTDYKHIKEDYENQELIIKNQIVLIESRQQELQNYIVTIDAGINHLQTIIMIEEKKKPIDYDKISRLRGSITKNIQMLNDLYQTYKEYEAVKFKYIQELGTSNLKFHHLLEVEIRRIDEKLDKNVDLEFIDIIQHMISKKNESSLPSDIENNVNNLLSSNPEFQL